MTGGSATLTLLACFRLATPALPIGGFSYSQGLETAIDRGWVADEASATEWIGDMLTLGLARYEAPLCLALFRAAQAGDLATLQALHDDFLASRETAELRAETEQMGRSLLHLLAGLDLPPAVATDVERRRSSDAAASLPLAWGLAAAGLGIPPTAALTAYLWAWAENQTMAALKAVPLGQQAGQRMLSALMPALDDAVLCAETLAEQPDNWHNLCPGMALASAWHETQYSRLFRS